MFFRLRLSTLASTIFRLRLPRKTLTPTTPTRQPWADVCNRGAVVKFELEGALYNAKKSIILYHMFLNFFSHAPFSVNYFCPRPTTRAVQCEYCCPPLQKFPDGDIGYLQVLGKFISRDVSRNFLRRKTLNFCTRISFGVWQNQSKFEAE